MADAPSSRQRTLSLFLLGALPCLLLALYTQHGWEDWYITFRAAKNLATGYGLVFQHGQILQTFTSPVNALLPAFLSWITGNTHDDLVLWLYRLIGAALLGGTVLMLDRLATLRGLSQPARWFMLLFFVVDFKVADFTINGQEAAFLVASVALMLVALIQKRTLLLGLAWAAMQWSRPDGFIYIICTSAGYTLHQLLHDRGAIGATFRRFLTACLLSLLFYGPWLAWTTWYYGSPIPHSAVAKGFDGATHTPLSFLGHLLFFPVQALLDIGTTTPGILFTPTNMSFGGWPGALEILSRLLGLVAMMAWLLPRADILLSTASMGALGGLFYLNYFAPAPCAWYFPPCIILAIVALAMVLDRVLRDIGDYRPGRLAAQAAAGLLVLVWLGTSLAASWETRVQQQLIEIGNRKNIGLWLHDHAGSPTDTVFLECLGYIGYYSNLKMYDYPGMSSPEMVNARGKVGEDPGRLIASLQPVWAVLRPFEANMVQTSYPGFAQQYQLAATFDKSAEVAAVTFLPGRHYVQYDQTFLVYHRVDASMR